MHTNELPDLSGWRIIDVWTIEEAALIWSGVDPWDYPDTRLVDLKPSLRMIQYRKAMTFQRALCEAVCRGAMPFEDAVELFTDLQNFGSWEKEVEFPDVPKHDRIVPHKTRLAVAAIIRWAKAKQIKTYRQILSERPAESAITRPSENDTLR